MCDKTLAIVIPAFKPDFFRQTLLSLERQSCQDFSVYIGDDASPHNLQSIVDEFSNSLKIHYTRFEDNLGSKNLVAHWERCIGLIGDEEWVWLFSDDDLVEADCVRNFADSKIGDDIDVVHFDIDIIDSSGTIVRRCPTFPDNLTPSDFFAKLYHREIVARMPEFVFRAAKLRSKGFVHFDLAWRTDNATVMECAYPGGIKTIAGSGSKVLWRESGNNISAVNGSLLQRKNESTISFFNWTDAFFKSNGIENPFSLFYFVKTLVFQLEYRGRSNFLADCRNASNELAFLKWYQRPLVPILSIYRLIYRNFE